jgi:Flp pilus assembly protein TadG
MRVRILGREDGQVILWLALGLPVLILFAAMAIDFGIIYQQKAKLSNAVDSAVLTGARNYRQGVTTAQNLATDMFQANFPNPASLSWTWCPAAGATCPGGQTIQVTLHASTQVNTTFMAYLPQWAQWNIGDTGQATKSNLVMSLILDRSGSMGQGPGCGGGTGDCGGVALQAAVPLFIADFAEGIDYVSMISFSDDARVDVAATQTFTSPIDTAVAALKWDGGTFGTGAGTNPFDILHGPPLNLADYQNNSVNWNGQPYIKVVVYFTDGLMNTVQDTLNCTNTAPGPGKTLYNYGGYDASSGNVFDFMDPTKDTWETGDLSYYYAGSTTKGSGTGVGCPATTGQNGFCNSNPPLNPTYSCKGVTTFPSQQFGAESFSRAAITAEAQYRAEYTAKAMRDETPVPTWIFVIGLGSAMTSSTEEFLATLANDNSGAYGNTPVVGEPYGMFVPAPDCPGVNCNSELNNAFQYIAAKILLRLSM